MAKMKLNNGPNLTNKKILIFFFTAFFLKNHEKLPKRVA